MPPERPSGPDSARRAEGIAAYASQFGLSEEETVAHMEQLLGAAMAAEAQHAAAAAWRKGALGRRDRSLAVIAALVTQGGVEERLRGHLRWAPENGLSRAEIEELITLLAVYVGYPKASVAMEALRDELGPGEGEG
jgi:4-carboxymuconolactone decarboxylase